MIIPNKALSPSLSLSLPLSLSPYHPRPLSKLNLHFFFLCSLNPSLLLSIRPLNPGLVAFWVPPVLAKVLAGISDFKG